MDSLTGLRFVAAFAVFALHSLSFGQHGWAASVFTAGTTGVSFFFLVSGFVMTWTARGDDTAAEFYRRRFARIYPAYAVTWLLSVALMLLDHRRPSLVDLVPLTLTQSWAPDEAVYWATNAVFWTLSCEAFFYLMFPLLHRAVRAWTVRSAMAGVAALIVLVQANAALAVAAGGGPTSHWLVTVFPVARLLEFLIGMLVGRIAVHGVRRSPPLWAAATFALSAFLLANHVPAAFRDVAVTILPFAVLVWAAAQADIEGRPSFLRLPALVRLGVWSYAFYLAHTLVLRVVFGGIERLGVGQELVGAPLLLATVTALVGSVAAAWLLHVAVEVPLESRLRPPPRRVARQRGPTRDGRGDG
ncbi:acyltransferase family protein [Blastococcus sp. VKM Ac-2987]|uniref:acyltransferase family protein n=1 Tax=Blastococcus sp. VKM Ac-2987 TaxID=3004141 RepID=UPI0022ABBA5D|nr:acyltransferase [Blastococcus sp. VKM Ac-2987]MCZ2858472.1 acyltransferase [Blastococcus sp. VKM Ac-2987]